MKIHRDTEHDDTTQAATGDIEDAIGMTLCSPGEFETLRRISRDEENGALRIHTEDGRTFEIQLWEIKTY